MRSYAALLTTTVLTIASAGTGRADGPGGLVVGWGDNSYSQLMNTSYNSASAIAAGPSHACAIQRRNGAVVCWGANDRGQAAPPPSVNGAAGDATAVTAGGAHSCAIQAGTGAVICWGDDDVGQATPPPSVDGTMGTATAISAGGAHSCAIQAGTSAIVCWGDDSHGQTDVPAVVPGFTSGQASAIAAGGQHPARSTRSIASSSAGATIRTVRPLRLLR